MPERIQLSRRKGWRKPENTVVVARPSKWGNPCRWKAGEVYEPATGERWLLSAAEARAIAVQGFRDMLNDPEARAVNGYPHDAEIRDELAGKNLACWCPLDQPCHADVLLKLANGGPS